MSKRISLQELAELTDSELVGDPQHAIENVDNLESACEHDASFLANLRYKERMKSSEAGVICIDKSIDPTPGKNFLISDNPSLTFQKIAEILLFNQIHETGFKGIHETAVIHGTAQIGRNVTIGPHCVIDQGAIIGDGTAIHPNATIGPAAQIGKDCIIHANATVRERCILHDRVIIQPGAVIGSCGYGYTTDPKTGRHTKLDQIGIVILEDDVEIGANTTIDRARFKNTLIRKGTKIDNLVQIAHNVELGENNIIVSQSGIAGSAKLGNNVFLGGQAGVVGHVTITDNVKVATRGGVSKSIPEPGIYGGGPVTTMAEFNKRQVYMRKIGTYVKQIEELEKRIEKLEKK